MTQHRKLIEVAMPLEEINRESAREKSIRHGHPSTLHLWWARRPLAAARAVLFAQLVDDPSSHPDRFPTEEAQQAERERLHDIIRRLVVWENIHDEALLREAHAEIVASAPDGNPPPILDPFAGGGTIPLEAQRLGLEAHASDLNPVAVLINKALIEIPPKFDGKPPVFPGAADEKLGDWPGAAGMAEDVRRYGEWMRERAVERIGHLYPKASLPDGNEADVIAWIWARTVRCPNPACGIEMPLVRSWWLRKKRDKKAYVVPEIVDDTEDPSGKCVSFSITESASMAPSKENDGTMSGRGGAVCVACGSFASPNHIKAEGISGRMSVRLMAIVAEGQRGRIYLAADDRHRFVADITTPRSAPWGQLPNDPRNFWTTAYGLTDFRHLFTNRQLHALTTFSDLIGEAWQKILGDSATPRGAEPAPNTGSADCESYADAVTTYLAIVLSKLADRGSSLVTWFLGRESTRNTFSRHTVPMSWDFVEVNTLGGGTGSFSNALEWTAESLDSLPNRRPQGTVGQSDAGTRSYAGFLVSTDPPYYDNISYSDLSDYFYVWLRRSLQGVHPELFETMLVPKSSELVANPYRHGGRAAAESFFEEGFTDVFSAIRGHAGGDYPITVYYAFKQAELAKEGVTSTGWATMIQGMIDSGWAITATWPVRSELGNRMIASGTNALASSIVLALRPRPEDAEVTTRRGFVAALRAELPKALTRMRETTIAPVDFAQATIGPGMAVFSRYSEVIEADGTPMSVKTALALINQTLDEVLEDEDGDLDPDTRFCLAWYSEYGWDRAAYGDAEGLARRFNVAVDAIARGGVLTAREGWVQLTRPTELDATWRPDADDRVSHWEVTLQLARTLASRGVDATAAILGAVRVRGGIDLDAVERLALRLYRLAEKRDPSDAGLFNTLGTEWPNLLDSASVGAPVQDDLDFETLMEEH